MGFLITLLLGVVLLLFWLDAEVDKEEFYSAIRGLNEMGKL